MRFLINALQALAISTDSRDSGKAAYQQYAVVSDYNACRLPHHLSSKNAAPLGVAFVAASLALGMCIGMDFRGVKTGLPGPNVLYAIRSTSRDQRPEDIRSENFHQINKDERVRAGDWIAIGEVRNSILDSDWEAYRIRLISYGNMCYSAYKTSWLQSYRYYRCRQER